MLAPRSSRPIRDGAASSVTDLGPICLPVGSQVSIPRLIPATWVDTEESKSTRSLRRSPTGEVLPISGHDSRDLMLVSDHQNAAANGDTVLGLDHPVAFPRPRDPLVCVLIRGPADVGGPPGLGVHERQGGGISRCGMPEFNVGPARTSGAHR